MDLESTIKNPLMERVITVFEARYGRAPELLVRAPGRVNLLGAHVDYNEGWVLPAATEQAIWLAAARGADAVTIRALDFEGATTTFPVDPVLQRDASEEVTWADYPRGVAWTLQKAGHLVTPMDVLFCGDVPIGAGMGSSAAVEVAFLAAWNFLGDLNLDGLTTARLGQQTENEYIGLASGIMDQFASVHGADSQLVLLDCRTLSHEMAPLPAHCAILVADSGVQRSLATSEYNVRRRQCEQAVSILSKHLAGIGALRDVSSDQLEALAHHLPIVLRRRAQHVIDECRRVLQGADALKEGNVALFGQLMRRSHISARDLYEVSIPELDLLAATAWQVEGCYGARLTGAGFGGCVVVLADAAATAQVERALKDAYRAAFSRDVRVFQTSACDGVRLLKLGADATGASCA